MANEFEHLFSPIKIGNKIIKNRIFSSAHLPRFRPMTAPPNEREISYYETRARGGVGLIITGGHYISWPTTLPNTTAYEHDSIIPEMKKLADAIHKHGATVFAQIEHPGCLYSSRMAGGGAVMSSSPVPRREPFNPDMRFVPHAMHQDEINRVVQTFGTVVTRFKKAGYDGVECTAMFGKLAASFLSKKLNQRTDMYGGSLENRIRFLLEIINAMRTSVGKDFIIGVRFSGDEFLEGGNTLEDGKRIAQILEATGQVDYLFPCAGSFGPPHIPPMFFPLSSFAYLAAAIKEATELPVFTVGRINDPALAESILENNQADMVGMTRATLCDPDMPAKAREGRLEHIRHCIGCMEGCCANMGIPITCTLNPVAGREAILTLEKATTRKKVMIVGAGAAGLETARICALRGHDVHLYDREPVIAKELRIAARCPGREDFEEAARYFENQMKFLGVHLHLGEPVDHNMVVQAKYDAVVIATGAEHNIPDVPGSNSSNVVEMRQVILDEVNVGDNVLVADCQSHALGMDTAEVLLDRGKKVELVVESACAGDQLDNYTIEAAHLRVLRKGCIITTFSKVREIKEDAVILENTITGMKRPVKDIDTVVFCTDGIADDALYCSLKGVIPELYYVGQCIAPRKLLDSIYDGTLVGRKI